MKKLVLLALCSLFIAAQASAQNIDSTKTKKASPTKDKQNSDKDSKKDKKILKSQVKYIKRERKTK